MLKLWHCVKHVYTLSKVSFAGTWRCVSPWRPNPASTVTEVESSAPAKLVWYRTLWGEGEQQAGLWLGALGVGGRAENWQLCSSSIPREAQYSLRWLVSVPPIGAAATWPRVSFPLPCGSTASAKTHFECCAGMSALLFQHKIELHCLSFYSTRISSLMANPALEQPLLNYFTQIWLQKVNQS